MTKTLPFLLAATFLLATLLVFPDGAIASVFCLFFAAILGFALQTLADEKPEKNFLWNLFLAALILRILYGTLAYYFDFWLYFAGDAETYNFSGNVLAEYLKGSVTLNEFESLRFFGFRQSGWGMFWLIGFVYTLSVKTHSPEICFVQFSVRWRLRFHICVQKNFSATAESEKLPDFLSRFFRGLLTGHRL